MIECTDETMDVCTDSKKIDELLTRGVDEVIHEESIRKKL